MIGNRQINKLIVKSPDSFKVSCVVEGVATQQQQLDQVPRDVASWFIRVIRVISYQISQRVSHIQICQSYRSNPSHQIDD